MNKIKIPEKGFQKNSIAKMLLISIVCIGAYLRFQGILTNSFAFTYDVGRDMLAVRDIVVNHKIPLIGQTTGLEGLFYGPWWYYILTIPFVLSNGNPQYIAFFIAGVNILAILLAYILGKRIGGIFLGIAFSSLISFSPFFVGVSSQIWNPNLIPFIALLVLFLLSSIFSKKNHSAKTFFAIGLALALILDFEFVFGALFGLSVVLFLLLFQKGVAKKNYGMLLFGALIINTPKIIFEFRHGFLMTNSVLKIFLASHTQGVSFGVQVVSDRLRIFLNLLNDTFGNKETSFFIAIVALFVFTLFYQKQKSEAKKIANFSLFVLGVFIVGSLFISRAIWGYYFIGIPLFYLVLVSMGLDLLQKHTKKYYGFFLLFLILFFLLKPLEIINSFTKPLFEGDAAVYRNQLSVIDYIYQAARGEKFNYIVYTPPVHDYTYRYLFMWYGPKKYHYSPSGEKESLFYVILEPDFENPNRLRDWFLIREGDGKIIKEEVVKGGIRVQLRKH